MKHYTYLLILILSIGFTSCISDIPYKGGLTEPKLYVTANVDLTIDSAFIFVGQSSFFLTTPRVTDCFSDAKVTITHRGNTQTLRYHEPNMENGTPWLGYDGEYNFKPQDRRYDGNEFMRPVIGYYLWQIPNNIEAGDTLYFEASKDGFDPVRSPLIVPQPHHLTLLEKSIRDDGEKLKMKLQISCPKPNVETTAIYMEFHTKIKYATEEYNQTTKEYEIVYDTSEYSNFSSIDKIFVTPDDIFEFETPGDYWSPVTFLSNSLTSYPYTINIEVKHSDKNLWAAIDTIPTEYLGTTITFRNYSYEKYRYEIARYNASDAEDNPFAEPVVTYTNIEGGFGYFSVTHSQTVVVTDDN